MTPALAALFGVGAGAGLWLLITGWRRVDRSPHWAARLRRAANQRTALKAVATAGIAVIVGAATGWLVGAILAGLATWTLPRVLGADRAHAARVARFEAVAAWAEMLRDTLAAAAGLEQAIIVTAPLTPAAIRDPLTAAAARLQAGERLGPVLRDLGEQMADPTADLVISALVLAAEQRARHLGDLLGSLAQTAREHAALRMRIHAGRAEVRSEVRITVGATLAFEVGLVLLDRRYLAGYDTTTGQLVLMLVGGLFTLGFALLTRIARIVEPARFLHRPDPADPSASRPAGRAVRS